MFEGRELDRSLLTEIRSRLERLSESQHRLARDHRILAEAATELRLGKECPSRAGRDQRAESGAAAGLLRHSAPAGPGAFPIDRSHHGIGLKADVAGKRLKEADVTRQPGQAVGDGVPPSRALSEALRLVTNVSTYWRNPSCRIIPAPLCHMPRNAGRLAIKAMLPTHEAK